MAEGQTLDRQFEQRWHSYDEYHNGVVFEDLATATWVEPLWEPEAEKGVEPPWKTATPKLRKLRLMGPITKLPGGHGPVPIGVKLKQELQKTCEGQGLEVELTSPRSDPQSWLVEEGDEEWPPCSSMEWGKDSDGEPFSDDEWDSDHDWDWGNNWPENYGDE